MNLDLRRYGKNLYTKAEESGGSDQPQDDNITIDDIVSLLNIGVTTYEEIPDFSTFAGNDGYYKSSNTIQIDDPYMVYPVFEKGNYHIVYISTGK